MLLPDLNGKNVCILGFGKEGHATLRALETYAPDATITIADANPDIEHGDYPLISGRKLLETIDRQHVAKIIKSPGIPPHPLFEKWKREDRLTTGTQLFFEAAAHAKAMIIGVTGSKGKSTTSSLIYEILKAGGKDVYLVGNIGKPALDLVGHMKEGAIFVHELSSYQLMDLAVSPHIAVVTSFFPEHLDYHGSLEAYLDAKAHIARFQKPEDIIVYAKGFEGTQAIAEESPGRHIAFGAKDSPVNIEEIRLIGEHNLSNIAAAFTVSQLLEIPEAKAVHAIKSFEGLPHRLQAIGMHHGIEWIDDAISTTPESAMAAIKALGNRVKTIILGGQDRGLAFEEFGAFIAGSGIEQVIVFPGSGPRMQEAVEEALHNRPPDSPPIPHPFPPRGERGDGSNEEIERWAKKPLNAKLKEHARTMRKAPTKAEDLLWEHLRNNQLGMPFRRQHPIGGNILDFYCHDARLGIEVDGEIHREKNQRELDALKEENIATAGIRILRFTNEEVMQSIQNVLKKITQSLVPPPPVGEGPGVRVQSGEGVGMGEKNEVEIDSYKIAFHPASSMQEAVSIAKKVTPKGSICLLSTASPSYGMFKNFEEKGEQFQKYILS